MRNIKQVQVFFCEVAAILLVVSAFVCFGQGVNLVVGHAASIHDLLALDVSLQIAVSVVPCLGLMLAVFFFVAGINANKQ